MSRIRSNAHPIVLTSGFWGDYSATHTVRVERLRRRGKVNPILQAARELRDGDTFGWAMELLYATQILRVAYDSARIGGGIDPNVATNVPGLESGRDDCSTLAYIIGDNDEVQAHIDSAFHDATRSGASYRELADLAEETSEPGWHMGILDEYDADRVQDFIVHAEAVAVGLIDWCRLAGTDY